MNDQLTNETTQSSTTAPNNSDPAPTTTTTTNPEQKIPPEPAAPETPSPEPPSPQPSPAPKKKRNSGRSGPKSILGRLRSSQNAIKHGACAETLILPCESEPAFQLLLARWCREYYISEAEQTLINTAFCGACTDHSLTYDFVRRAAEADWHRLRCQRNYDVYARMYIDGRTPFNWSPEEVKMHDLHLRYKTAADRVFHRENRALQQHVKFSQEQKRWHEQEQGKEQEKQKAALAAAQPEPPAQPSPATVMPTFTVIAVDHDSPTGYSILSEIINGVKVRNPRPVEPPNPIPADWPKPWDFPREGDPGSSGS